MDQVRLDKYLWAIRVYKSRNDATEACKGNKVHVNGTVAKPSKMIKTDDLLTIRKGAVLFTYRVKALVENRLGAKLVPDFAENLTPQAELDKMKAPAETFFVRRDRGAGRPTKRDRRIMDEMLDNLSYFEDDSPDGDY
ncbi:MAG: RNA-binding S4 domain-containing protein [Bacteroidales bacterium]|nr:RNA-binding S4 domain-containing protein [Bacteroidales bacterium]